MRQVGILCAAAFVAVQENVGKLEGDHRNAKILAGRYTSPLDLHAIAIGGKNNYRHALILFCLFNCSHVQLLETFFSLSLSISRRVESNERSKN
jgi:hypothetical protein